MNTIYNTGKCQWTHGEEISGDWHKLLGPCPLCGTPTFDYGGGWRCRALYCNNNASNPIGNLGPLPEWWNTGIQVKKDGNAWWAHGADYVDPMESIVGWGDTPAEAVKEFLSQNSKTKAA